MEVIRMICLLVAVILWILATFNSVQAQTVRINLVAAGLVAFGLAFLIPAVDALSK
jgi:hypothetical protein